MDLLKDVLMVEAVGAVNSHGWKIDPNGYNIYVVQSGDTYRTLASTYLGSSDLWPMIWNDQSEKWRVQVKGNDVNNLRVGDELYMPSSAIAQARSLGWAAGGKGAPPGHETASAVYAGAVDPPPPVTPPVTPGPGPAPSTPTSGGGFMAFWNGLSPIAKTGVGVTAVLVVGAGVALLASAGKSSSRDREYSEAEG